jgi:hypothetical protein
MDSTETRESAEIVSTDYMGFRLSLRTSLAYSWSRIRNLGDILGLGSLSEKQGKVYEGPCLPTAAVVASHLGGSSKLEIDLIALKAPTERTT